MSNKQIYSLIGVVVVIAAIGIVWAMRSNTSTTSIEEQKGTSTLTQDTPAEQTTQPATATTQTAQPETLNGCTRTVDKSKMTATNVDFANKRATLQVKGLGTIAIDLYDKDAPKTVENFVRLANSGYFDCLTFHRIAKGFVVQGGDPTGTGSGGDSAFGGTFTDELNAETPSYKQGYIKGVVAMANRGPNTNTSQFFIMLGDAELPHLYTIFGKVSSGQEVVDAIGKMDITPELGPTDGKPKQPVVIEKATVSSK